MKVLSEDGRGGVDGTGPESSPLRAASSSAPGSHCVPSNRFKIPSSQYVGTPVVARNIFTDDEVVSAALRLATIARTLTPATWPPFVPSVPGGAEPGWSHHGNATGTVPESAPAASTSTRSAVSVLASIGK